jgi:hypothetical protein
MGGAVTPRGTDWGLALPVALGLASGPATWFAGSPDGAWVFGARALAGLALALLLVFKLRWVLPGVGSRARRDPRTLRGLLALGLVLAVLVSGTVWSTAGRVAVAGYTVLFWHAALGRSLRGLRGRRARSRALDGPAWGRRITQLPNFPPFTAFGDVRAGALDPRRRCPMRIPKKAVALTAAVAVMAPVGISQATHESGRAGAPGQVCKPLLQARQAQIKQARESGATRAQIKQLRKTQQAAYKGCVRAAAKARSADKPAESTP